MSGNSKDWSFERGDVIEDRKGFRDDMEVLKRLVDSDTGDRFYRVEYIVESHQTEGPISFSDADEIEERYVLKDN